MKNKQKLKRYLMILIAILICALFGIIMLSVIEYRAYTSNFNNKLSSIISKVLEDYPEVSENEIMEIFKAENDDAEIFKKYSIDLNEDSLISSNDNYFYKFLILDIAFMIAIILIIVLLFFKYERNRDKSINEITKYIEEINRKNYTLKIDEISEDELSILKNEIYKTTVMLKEQAENSSKDKLQLKKSLEDISHQLKTPITSILIILDDLIDNPDMDAKIREDFIRDIKREMTSINFLVQSILKLSKFDANAVNYINKEVKIADLINESVKNMEALCDLKNVRIEVDCNLEDSLICDFNWQIEAITNILKNCIEHSYENSKIEIRAEKNKVYSMIEIQDYGTGIDNEDLSHIFERFYKGKNSSENSIGIGLALSKTIIEENNGIIDVKSEVGKGTNFKIKYFEVI